MIGRSPRFLAEAAKIPRLARYDVPVLICGETGTGKEIFARGLHSLSPRSRGPFVPVNCGALPAELIENELFGHDRGAFTGAERARPGLVEAAGGGTLLLDEVDSLPLAAQAKLLRFLQEKEFRRLGSTRLVKSDVRILAATNTAIADAVEGGRFRSDLFYRLNVVPIHLPPLRDRREDIPLLAEHFLARDTRRFGRSLDGFDASAMAALTAHDWPGNVRELEHVVRRAVVLTEDTSTIGGEFLFQEFGQAEPPSRQLSFKEAKAQVVASFERRYLVTMLTAHRGNISRAARAAQKNRRAFFELIRKYQIDVSRFRSP